MTSKHLVERMHFFENELSSDSFLGGALSLLQPKEGYRAATDPVYLAAATCAGPGQTVLELGCGVGTALLCLGHRVGGLRLNGVEIQAGYAELARRNAEANGFEVDVHEADITHLPEGLKSAGFDHVIINPPYLRVGAGTAANNKGKETAFREETPLSAWIDIAVRRLRPKGYLTVIHQADRLPDLMVTIDQRIGSVEVKPLVPRVGKPAGRVLLRARKGAKGSFVLHSPLVIHEGQAHVADGDSYTPEVSNILRNGAALDF